MRHPTVILTTLVLAFGFTGHAAAQLSVPGDHATIQAALSAAPAGSVITVAPGTYFEQDLDFEGKDLVLRSSGGPSVTIIDPQTQGRGFIFDESETTSAVVEGFTIRNGKAPDGAPNDPILNPTGDPHGGNGGGIYVTFGSSPTILRCRFENCEAGRGGNGVHGGSLFAVGRPGGHGGHGGGLGCDSGSPRIVSCEFLDCLAGDGGNGGHGSSGGSLFPSGNGGAGGDGGQGGGVSVTGGAAVVESCTFFDNEAGLGGAGGNGGGSSSDGAPGPDGSGLSIRGVNNTTIDHCIAWGTQTGQIEGGSTSRSNVFGGPSNGDGTNIDVDPVFVDAANGDLHLDAGSPCIDAGDPLHVGLAAHDIDGDARIAAGRIDIGADEVPPALPGTGDDFTMHARIGDGEPKPELTATPGDVLAVTLLSPAGAFDFVEIMLVVQAYTGPTPTGPLGFEDVLHFAILGTPPPVVAFGATSSALGPPVLLPGGTTVAFVIPTPLLGWNLIMQGIAVGGPSANGIFSSTYGAVVDVD